MGSLTALVQALGVAYASGINLYATVAVLGGAARAGWIGPLPGALDIVASPWVIGIATALYLFEFTATLVPGVASAWETFHSIVRPPAAAALAVATMWHGDALLVILAALLGGGLAVTTHATKLGFRYAIDTSPEPVTNAAANLSELGIVAMLGVFVWQYPYLSLAIALVVLVLMILLVRRIWRTLRRVFTGHWMPGCGLLQQPRSSIGAYKAAGIDADDD
jgi:hypothetical protein